MRVLSLFDGMACGMIAFRQAGIEVESYDAYEIDKYAIKTASHNFPLIRHNGDVFTADFTKYKGVDFIIGGSPCTYWSIAQKNNRETEASGLGWELFSQYTRAIKEAEPKYFIYENNYSMSAAIRESIDKAFGFSAVYINSALVSAQIRKRLYWVGKRNADGSYSKVDVKQPKDRGQVLKDILESGVVDREKAYALVVTHQGNARDYFKKRHAQIVYEFIDYEPRKNSDIVINDNSIRCVLNDKKKSSAQETVIKFTQSKANAFVAAHTPKVIDKAENYKTERIYKVENGFITIKGKQYPIKLADGYYIIRKLTVTECKRLQTVPEWYDFPVSNAQAYKMLGNGWTVEVIAHLITAALTNQTIADKAEQISIFDIIQV